MSNWEKWGRDDQLGTLHYITPKKVRDAAKLVRTGRVISIAHDIVTVTPEEAAAEEPHRSTLRRQGWSRPAILKVWEPTGPIFAVLDEFTIRCHGYASTHLDALTHCGFDGQFWNGMTPERAVTHEGVRWASIYAMRDGIVTRGVLLDVAKARGVAHLEREDTVTVADLNTAERLSGTKVTSGDAVFVRSGMGLRIDTPEDLATRAGLAPECARWLHAREVAMLGTDCPEKRPSGYDDSLSFPFHQIVLAQMGLALLDHVAMEPLAAACAEEGRSTFMVTVAPLRLQHASGSVVNPLALF